LKNLYEKQLKISVFGFLFVINILLVYHITGLSWANKYCPEAQWTVKTDDDISVNVFAMKNYMQSLWSEYKEIKNKLRIGIGTTS